MVYLIHFEKPYKHARHYIGFTDNLDQRFYDHTHNVNGARLLQVVSAAGIKFSIARTWDGDRALERRLKKWKKSSELCPVCRAEAKERRKII